MAIHILFQKPGYRSTIKKMSMVLALMLLCGAPFQTALADHPVQQSPSQKQSSSVGIYGYERTNTYDHYMAQYASLEQPEEEVLLPAASITGFSAERNGELGSYAGKDSVLLWKKNTGDAEWKLDIEKAGLYRISMEYCPMEGTGWSIEMGMEIDGAVPFDEAARFSFTRTWKDGGKIQQDDRGNDIRPGKKEVEQWREEFFTDADGRHAQPFFFFLDKGTHTLRLTGNKTGIALAGLKIKNISPLPGYDEYLQKVSNKESHNSQEELILQGETPYLTSDTTLHGMYDRTSAATEPSHPVRLRINTIGQQNWRNPGQWITWRFHVPKDGFYTIYIRARQNYVRGFFSTREISIDGQVPFKELQEVKFPYSSQWYMKTLGDEKPYRIYLTEGEHEITMKSVPGEVSNVVRNLEDAVYKLNYIYRKIIMITGVSPDPYRDYLLEKEIPGLTDFFKDIISILDSSQKELDRLGVQRGSDAIIINKLLLQLNSFCSKPDTIAVRLKDYQSNVSALSAWILSLKEQPLEIDYFQIAAEDVPVRDAKAGFFTQMMYKIKAFIGSFTEDYSMVGKTYDGQNAINVWISMGRDHAQVLKDLIDNEFSSRYGIPVNLSLVQQGFVEATLAGRGPDIALMIGSGDPVNLAARGALADLSQFADYEQVKDRFAQEAMTPFKFRGKVYGLPVQQGFYMMFYRKDILNDLGIKPPKTWDEFYSIVPIIQRNNMQVGITNFDFALGSAGSADNGMFDTLLFQRGGTYFNEDQSKTGFESKEALEAFKQWTDFYTKYRFPMTFNFYNRFRTGEMPLGIQGYTLYNLLTVAAPEIRNLWEMEPVPGTVRADGTVDRSVTGGGTAAVMFEKMQDKEAGWKFLSWFTSADIQNKFGRTLESMIGPAARYDTANLEAIRMLPWSESESNKLLDQMKYLRCTPQNPASYYLQRNITNAFRGVTIRWENPRETLYLYNKEINKEILRKRIELGMDQKKASVSFDAGTYPNE